MIASTLLMALVMAIRAPVRRLFGPQLGYVLWALPLLRLLLPPLPERWQQVTATPIARAGETLSVIIITPGTALSHVVAPHAQAPAWTLPSLGLLLGLLWLTGSAAFLCWHLAAHDRFCRRLLRFAARIERLDGVSVIASEAATGPLAFGVLRRYVAFPLDFDDRYDADERELALAHEIGHHQRGDLVANWAALAVLAIHWFNPIAWRAFRAFRADQELANDARVLAGRSTIDRHAYACAIIKAAHGGAVSAACHLHTIDDLKGRIRMLSTLPRSRGRIATGGAMVTLLVLSGLGLTASGTSAAAALTGKVGETIGMNLQMPPAPRAPAARVAPAAPAAPDAEKAADAGSADEAPESPEAPPAPPRGHSHAGTVTIADDRVTMTDGAVRARDGLPISAAGVPLVSERVCDGRRNGDDHPVVIQTREHGRKAMIICSDRIAKMAAAATAQAAAVAVQASVAASHAVAMALDSKQIRLDAMNHAIAGMRAARLGIVNEPTMSADQRRAALQGIDRGIADMRQQLSEVD
nr:MULTISPECIES: M56 family metallopeptidase [unclassified Sphingomonas]